MLRLYYDDHYRCEHCSQLWHKEKVYEDVENFVDG